MLPHYYCLQGQNQEEYEYKYECEYEQEQLIIYDTLFSGIYSGIDFSYDFNLQNQLYPYEFNIAGIQDAIYDGSRGWTTTTPSSSQYLQWICFATNRWNFSISASITILSASPHAGGGSDSFTLTLRYPKYNKILLKTRVSNISALLREEGTPLTINLPLSQSSIYPIYANDVIEIDFAYDVFLPVYPYHCIGRFDSCSVRFWT